ncbi:MAG: alpha/beta hydrolase [Bacteroidota bacterium]
MKVSIFSILTVCLMLTACTKSADENFEHFYLRNGNADLYVEINGNIASKVFFIYLHGGPGGGSLAYNMGYFAEEMEVDYAMVYLDQRGNGASQGGNEEGDLTIAQNSEDIYQLAQILQAKYGDDISIFLAGHSWGGLTSAHALLNTEIQSILRGWVEMNGAHDFPLNDVEAVKMFQTLGQQEIDAGNNLDFWEPVVERVNQIDINNITGEDSGYMNSKGFEAEGMFDLADEEIAGVIPHGLAAPQLSLATLAANGAANGILNEDSNQYALTDQLNQIEIPCLFLWGKYDFVVPPALGVSAFARVGTNEKQLIIYERSGHSPMSNEAIQFTQDVKDFIELYK